QSKEAYQIVCDVTEKACAHLGYGHETSLEPPLVPFDKRGSYRKRYPPLEAQLVIAALNDADVSRDRPQKRIAAHNIWNQAAWEIYNRSLSALSPEKQKLVKTQVDAIVQDTGWQIESVNATIYYVQPLSPDIDKARQAITAVITEAKGTPISHYNLVSRVHIAAYSRRFHERELTPQLEEYLRLSLTEAGYVAQPEGGEYLPLPIKLPPNAEAGLNELLPTIAQRQTQLGTALLLSDIQQGMQETFNLP
ncbi:MAG: hypothetical protein GY803_21390, partial [Chloroflexi bacterium]|nr:hypothetical protein [Chloroflexota bacterium]